MPNEDVSIGFWLMSVDLRRIDNQRVMPPDCCLHKMPAPAGHVTSATPFLTDSVVGASIQNHDGVSSSSSCQLPAGDMYAVFPCRW